MWYNKNMRLKVYFGDESGKVRIGMDYRRAFLSFIKKAFSQTPYMEDIFQEKKAREFVFSAFLGKGMKADGEKLEVSPPFELYFSSGAPFIVSAFYNGVMELKKKGEGIELEGKKFGISRVEVLRPKKFTSSFVIFKTLGICVLTDPDASRDDFEKFYVIPEREDFKEILRKRIIEKYEFIMGSKIPDERINFLPVSRDLLEPLIRSGAVAPSFWKKSLVPVRVRHYGGYVRGWRGVFGLEAHPVVLQFVYDYGLGVKTGQGFGMLECVMEA